MALPPAQDAARNACMTELLRLCAQSTDCEAVTGDGICSVYGIDFVTLQQQLEDATILDQPVDVTKLPLRATEGANECGGGPNQQRHGLVACCVASTCADASSTDDMYGAASKSGVEEHGGLYNDRTPQGRLQDRFVSRYQVGMYETVLGMHAGDVLLRWTPDLGPKYRFEHDSVFRERDPTLPLSFFEGMVWCLPPQQIRWAVLETLALGCNMHERQWTVDDLRCMKAGSLEHTVVNMVRSRFSVSLEAFVSVINRLHPGGHDPVSAAWTSVGKSPVYRVKLLLDVQPSSFQSWSSLYLWTSRQASIIFNAFLEVILTSVRCRAFDIVSAAAVSPLPHLCDAWSVLCYLRERLEDVCCWAAGMASTAELSQIVAPLEASYPPLWDALQRVDAVTTLILNALVGGYEASAPFREAVGGITWTVDFGGSQSHEHDASEHVPPSSIDCDAPPCITTYIGTERAGGQEHYPRSTTTQSGWRVPSLRALQSVEELTYISIAYPQAWSLIMYQQLLPLYATNSDTSAEDDFWVADVANPWYVEKKGLEDEWDIGGLHVETVFAARIDRAVTCYSTLVGNEFVDNTTKRALDRMLLHVRRRMLLHVQDVDHLAGLLELGVLMYVGTVQDETLDFVWQLCPILEHALQARAAHVGAGTTEALIFNRTSSPFSAESGRYHEGMSSLLEHDLRAVDPWHEGLEPKPRHGAGRTWAQARQLDAWFADGVDLRGCAVARGVVSDVVQALELIVRYAFVFLIDSAHQVRNIMILHGRLTQLLLPPSAGGHVPTLDGNGVLDSGAVEPRCLAPSGFGEKMADVWMGWESGVEQVPVVASSEFASHIDDLIRAAADIGVRHMVEVVISNPSLFDVTVELNAIDAYLTEEESGTPFNLECMTILVAKSKQLLLTGFCSFVPCFASLVSTGYETVLSSVVTFLRRHITASFSHNVVTLDESAIDLLHVLVDVRKQVDLYRAAVVPIQRRDHAGVTLPDIDDTYSALISAKVKRMNDMLVVRCRNLCSLDVLKPVHAQSCYSDSAGDVAAAMREILPFVFRVRVPHLLEQFCRGVLKVFNVIGVSYAASMQEGEYSARGVLRPRGELQGDLQVLESLGDGFSPLASKIPSVKRAKKAKKKLLKGAGDANSSHGSIGGSGSDIGLAAMSPGTPTSPFFPAQPLLGLEAVPSTSSSDVLESIVPMQRRFNEQLVVAASNTLLMEDEIFGIIEYCEEHLRAYLDEASISLTRDELLSTFDNSISALVVSRESIIGFLVARMMFEEHVDSFTSVIYSHANGGSCRDTSLMSLVAGPIQRAMLHLVIQGGDNRLIEMTVRSMLACVLELIQYLLMESPSSRIWVRDGEINMIREDIFAFNTFLRSQIPSPSVPAERETGWLLPELVTDFEGVLYLCDLPTADLIAAHKECGKTAGTGIPGATSRKALGKIMKGSEAERTMKRGAWIPPSLAKHDASLQQGVPSTLCGRRFPQDVTWQHPIYPKRLSRVILPTKPTLLTILSRRKEDSDAIAYLRKKKRSKYVAE